MHTIKIFSAGVAGGLTKQAAEEFQCSHPDVNCQVELGGSTGGIRKLLAGAEYDVMVLADCSNIEEMMMPEYADGYCVWAETASWPWARGSRRELEGKAEPLRTAGSCT